MAKAKKLASGSWRVQVFSHYEIVDGVKKPRYRSFTAPTRAEAEMQASLFANDKKRYSRANLTVSEAVQKYIQAKETVLSPTTIRTYEQIAKTHLTTIGPVMIDTVTNADLQNWISKLSVKLSAKTVKNVYTLVTSAISLYTEKSFKVTLPTRAPHQYNIPTDADVAQLIKEARPDLKLAIVLGSCGLRRGEVCALKYADILRDFSAIYIHADMVLDKHRKWIYKDIPKTSDSVRSVELPPQVIQMLGDGDPDAFIIKSTPAAISDAFSRLRNRLGMSCRFHDLRHYSASIMHAIGIPDQYIMQRHGWSSDTVLKSVYRNTLADKSNQFTHMANDYFAHNVLAGNGDK
jgi:integrase